MVVQLLKTGLGSSWAQRELLWSLAWRDVSARYRSSLFGVLWAVFHPLAMLATYTFVFSVVLQMRWSAKPGAASFGGHADFALILFSGLLLYTLFAEGVQRAPTAITGNANLVKKVVFPLQLLPLVPLLSALVNAAIGLFVLLLAQWWLRGSVPPTALYAPLVVLPLLVLAAGLAWGLAAFSVFIPDIGQFVTPLVSLLMFLSPIFYPLEMLPKAWHGWMQLNPLTVIVEQFRRVLLWGQAPDWSALGLYSLAALGIAGLGLLAFQAMRKGFADVL
jgi:lipopolysaccharide transport system permease protein